MKQCKILQAKLWFNSVSVLLLIQVTLIQTILKLVEEMFNTIFRCLPKEVYNVVFYVYNIFRNVNHIQKFVKVKF